jgi:D-glycero-alpha-D-manno-heptose-7-phosphate kinase
VSLFISRTPFRVSLFGGGTDYPRWFREHGGAVFGAAINKYCYISVRALPPFFEHRHRIVYSKIETVREIADIQHPAVRCVLSDMAIEQGLEIHHDADLPARSGLGSSSSFTVGLLKALYAFRGQSIAADELGRCAIRIEQDVIKEAVGCQDQLWAAYGGLNRIDFSRDGAMTVSPIDLEQERRAELRQSLMLFFTGFSRFATEFAQNQIDNIDRRSFELSTIQAMVDQALGIVCDPRKPMRELGVLLDESWRMKRRLADGVSNDKIDAIYQAGREAGAIGGKLLGAGGGGFIVFVVEPGARARVRERLSQLVHVDFDFDDEGSQMVVPS